jgi:hypothetical protein
MRNLLLTFLIVLAMTATAGNFFPPEYKQFPYKQGDLLVSAGESAYGNAGKFHVSKILKVDRIDLKRGDVIDILGQKFVATEDDFLLIVSVACGAFEFDSFESARAAASSGSWHIELGHAPMRAPGAAKGHTLVGHAPVQEVELDGYRIWRAAFDRGEASFF